MHFPQGSSPRDQFLCFSLNLLFLTTEILILTASYEKPSLLKCVNRVLAKHVLRAQISFFRRKFLSSVGFIDTSIDDILCWINVKRSPLIFGLKKRNAINSRAKSDKIDKYDGSL